MLKKINQLAVLFLILIFGTACSNLNRSFSTENAKKIVTLSKGLCFGDCPSFDFTVYDNGILAFDGKRFTKRKGIHYKRVTKETIDEIRNTCVKTNLWRFNEIYRSRIPDAQTVTITFYDESGSIKRISGKDNRPAEILDLDDYLSRFAFSSDWYASESASSGEENPANEFIVKLNPGIEALAWSKSYEREELTLAKALSADKTYWKITFNPQVVSPQEFIVILRRDPDVFSVQQNNGF